MPFVLVELDPREVRFSQHVRAFSRSRRAHPTNLIGGSRLSGRRPPGRPGLPFDQIAPAVASDEASITARLQGNGACRLLTAPGEIFEIEPVVVDQQALRSAARAAGFVRTPHQWRLPDRRIVTLWENAAWG